MENNNTSEDQNQISDDIDELNEIGLSVWSEQQNVIEEAALKQLEALSAQTIDNRDANTEPNETSVNKKKEKLPFLGLDLDKYIESQRNLKNVKKKPVVSNESVSDQSLSVAERISKKQNHNTIKKEKRKLESVDDQIPSTSKKFKIDEIEADSNEIEEDLSGSEYIPSENDEDSDFEAPKTKKQPKVQKNATSSIHIEKVKDDGNITYYKQRLEKWNFKKEKRKQRMLNKTENAENADSEFDEDDEDYEDYPDKNLDYGLKVPGSIWCRLYRYQKTGVKWLNELNHQKVGGLLGDEMGLGKTVQIIAFLAALNHSNIVSDFGRYKGLGPSIIVSPATVLHQWVKHFHDWWPILRVAVLHQSGSFQGLKTQLIREINKTNGIIITTYQGILRYKGLLSELQWHYIILDEGHKIRNPTTKVTIAVKQFRTPHRLVLTGSPMQNNLTELWSLFDFIVPGKLGTVQAFTDHFATPIVHGGYANATPIQEATALSIAIALKNMITPFMLRRAKADVNLNLDLPNKNEQVLFCELTTEQRDLYKGYLLAEHVSNILDRGRSRCSNNQFRAKMLMALTTLRKICNHPDLYLGEIDDIHGTMGNSDVAIEERYGYYKRSGKMKVVAALLRIWKRQGHRVLLFTQSRSMIEIFQDFLQQNEYTFLKMDGSTSIGARQTLIDKFNKDESYTVFLLTTRVGGLGVNLTGANRVIIYDPDWNPATDMQARERAWRIGQMKQVTIYRLLSAGTIEEKMYQRQIWKQLLSNKVLSDPRQRRFFKSSDLQELFSLHEPTPNGNLETSNLFKDSKVEISSNTEGSENIFSKDKIEKMKLLAQKLAKTISSSTKVTDETNDNSKQNKSLNAENDQTNSKQSSEDDECFIWDPTTVRFRKPRKIIIPWEPPEINLVDDQKTDVSFNDLLVEIDTKVISTVPKRKSISDRTDLQIDQRDSDECNLDKNQQDNKTTTENISVEDEEKSRNEKPQEDNIEQEDGELKSDNEAESNNNGSPKKEKLAEEQFEKPKKKHKKSKKHKYSKHRRNSCEVDGELVEGLVKKEKPKKSKEDSNILNDRQDEYVLQQLFSKGVHTALKHDSIVGSGCEESKSLKMRTEADYRAKAALKALRNSRLRNWRW